MYGLFRDNEQENGNCYNGLYRGQAAQARGSLPGEPSLAAAEFKLEGKHRLHLMPLTLELYTFILNP